MFSSRRAVALGENANNSVCCGHTKRRLLMAQTTQDRSGCLKGKVAVITGAARGIGRSTAIAFAHEGADVIGMDICAAVYPPSGVKPASQADLEETGRLVAAAGGRWLSLVVDQRDIRALRE